MSLVSSETPGSSRSPSPSPQYLVLDTDIGVDIDDDLALMAVLGFIERQRQRGGLQFELAGVTTVGVFPLVKSLQARFVLGCLGRQHVPVFSGEGRTVEGKRFNPFKLTSLVFCLCVAFRTLIGFFLCSRRRTERKKQSEQEEEKFEGAVDALLRLSREHEGRLHVLCIGPLTNVACAVREDPGFLSRLASLTFMGGLFDNILALEGSREVLFPGRGKGRLRVEGSEFGGFSSGSFLWKEIRTERDTNVRSDKKALDIIMRAYTALKTAEGISDSGSKREPVVRGVSLDSTLRCFIGPRESWRLVKFALENIKSPLFAFFLLLSFFLWSFVQFCIWRSSPLFSCSFLHDPLAVLCTLCEEAAKENEQLANTPPLEARQAEEEVPECSCDAEKKNGSHLPHARADSVALLDFQREWIPLVYREPCDTSLEEEEPLARSVPFASSAVASPGSNPRHVDNSSTLHIRRENDSSLVRFSNSSLPCVNMFQSAEPSAVKSWKHSSVSFFFLLSAVDPEKLKRVFFSCIFSLTSKTYSKTEP
uniref:Inosine/uridine-preferring nucleoside hydrolase domain-containing protein n=1 Tax=Chromera velia CCMP2878 TaxID=1169474 RepID=A0A0G4HJE2_9ALVE